MKHIPHMSPTTATPVVAKASGLTLLALFGACLAAWSAPSALIQIPTAEVIGPGDACLDVAGAVPTRGNSHLSDWVLESDFGLTGGIELGFDTLLNTLDNGAFFMKKMAGDRGGFAAAVGVNGIGFNGEPWNPYVVASSKTSPLRVHLGCDYAEPHWRALVGADYAATPDITCMADWISGGEGAWSAGVNLAFGSERQWGLMTGVIHERETGDDLFYVNIGFTFSLRES